MLLFTSAFQAVIIDRFMCSCSTICFRIKLLNSVFINDMLYQEQIPMSPGNVFYVYTESNKIDVFRLSEL